MDFYGLDHNINGGISWGEAELVGPPKPFFGIILVHFAPAGVDGLSEVTP